MLESEARAATRFTEAMQALQIKANEQYGATVANTVASHRIDMEAYYQQALAASEARSAEGVGRALERLDQLKESAAADGKKCTKTHRDLRSSVAAAEERAATALAEQRANIDLTIDERLQKALKEMECKFEKRFGTYERAREAMQGSQEEMDDLLDDLEKRQADLARYLDDLDTSYTQVRDEQASMRRTQEEVRQAMNELKQAQASADESIIDLKSHVGGIEDKVSTVEEVQATLEKNQAVSDSNLGGATVSIRKLEDRLGDVPEDHEDLWKTIAALEKEQADADGEKAEVASRVKSLEKTIETVQKSCASIDDKTTKLHTDFSNWRTTKQLSILNDELETRNKVTKALNTLEEHAKKLRGLRTDIEHEATQRRKLLVKTTGMAFAFANDSSLSGVGKSHYSDVKKWLDDFAARPTTTADTRDRAVHYSAWFAKNM